MTKLTYIDAINAAIEGNMTDEVKDKLTALIASLEKRNKKGGERKPTKTQRENEVLREDIVTYIGENGAQTATQIAVAFTLSNQKASALLTAETKGDAPRLVRFEEKRKAYFRVADGV